MIFFATNEKLRQEAEEIEKDYLEQFNLRDNESPFSWTYTCSFETAFTMMKNRKGRKIECYVPFGQCDGGTLYYLEKYFERRCKKEKFSEEDFDNYFIQLLDKKKLSEEEAEKKINELKSINNG